MRTRRRSFLKGAGVALGLPWLEALDARPARAAEVPLRMLVFFAPNGFNMNEWKAAGADASFTLAGSLTPLRPFARDVAVVAGLDNGPAAKGGNAIGDHSRGTAGFLTCVTAQPHTIKLARSVDQMIAAKIGVSTRLASLQLGTEPPPTGIGCDFAAPCAYTDSISWAGPTSPLQKIFDPRVAFDRLFGGLDLDATAVERKKRLAYRKSLIDGVRDQVTALSPRIAAGDRVRLDEYLTGLRALERRIDTPFAARCAPGVRPGAIPENRILHVELMIDLMAIAFQCDATRVITFMLANGLSNYPYPELNARGHHGVSHHQDLPEGLSIVARIDRWELEMFARLLDRLAKIDEGGTSLLHASLLYLSSDVEDGNQHRHTNLPIVLAGRARGALATGKHVVYPAGTPLANLYLTFLRIAGVDAAAFADSTGALPGLT